MNPNRTVESMNYSEFRSLVNEMRAAQKAYFKLRATETLELSKKLERAVDKALAEYDGGQGEFVFDPTERKER